MQTSVAPAEDSPRDLAPFDRLEGVSSADLTLVHNVIGRLSLNGAEQTLSVSEIVQAWEQDGVVKEAPRFEDQAEDFTRKTTFRATVASAQSYKRLANVPELT